MNRVFLLPNRPERLRDAEISGIWCYRNSMGQSLVWRVRLNQSDGTKDVLPLTFCRDRESGATAWCWRDLPAPRPLYGLEWLAMMPEAATLVVEGEKTCDAARRLLPNWVCISWPGGTNRVSTKYSNWSPVLNRDTRIVLWPDADPPGIKAMTNLADILAGRCQVVQPDAGWCKGFDLADAEAEGWDGARALAYLESHLITPQPRPEERVKVNVSSGDLEAQSRAVWDTLQLANDPPSLLTSATGLTIVDRDVFGRARRRIATADRLRHFLTSRLAFTRFSKEGEIATKPSDVLLSNLLIYADPPLKFLRRVTEVPILKPDGGVITEEGFDEASGIYYLPHPSLRTLEIGAEPPPPSEIEGALALIEDLLADFPFVAECDKAHAVAFVLVPLLRLTIAGRTPLFRFEAPQPRTGKTLLMRILAGLVCTAVCDISQTTDDEEWRKRITAALREEPDAILIDNATSLESPQLNKVLTDDVWADRQLGGNETVRYPVRCVFGATLNNPIISREIQGRSLRIRLDARSDRPELGRQFQHPNLEEYVRENRAALVGALVTIARATSGFDLDAPVLGGFESFARRMSAVLKAVGIKGFLQDRQDTAALSADEAALVSFVEAWGQHWSSQKVELSDLLPIAESIDGLPLGRSELARSRQTALGMLLHKHRGYTVGQWQISDPVPGRHARWYLIAVKHAPAANADGDSDEEATPF
jgi:hypothetical protein